MSTLPRPRILMRARKSSTAVSVRALGSLPIKTSWPLGKQQMRYVSIKPKVPQKHRVRSTSSGEKKTIPAPPLAPLQSLNALKLARRLAGNRPREDRVPQTGGSTIGESRGRNGERILQLPHVIYPGDTNIIELEDGRVMSFAMFGRLDPKREMIPMVLEAGTPGTRLVYQAFHEWGWNNFVPLICPDRPGMGYSTYVKSYTVVSHAQDVRALMRALGYRKYQILGTSGGGPFALAVAALAPKSEVLATGILVGAAPIEASRRGQKPGRWWREFVLTVFPWWAEMRLKARISRKWPNLQRDAVLLQGLQTKTREVRKVLVELEKWLRNGIKGYVQDWRAGNSYWGFELEALREKGPIHMVYGTKDKNTPLAGGRYMQDRIGLTCTLKEIPGADHYTAQEIGGWELRERLRKYK
ncbi:alpha/beta-hydrolase [Karstenula rhodostoma CBS 690.94]|uniref:Alpha/beta-hydrolase n=1 Tax=Karstenula rhodostoma CBS 690.94 TaxID=1392251 RepID=A0A9P4PHX6_9PLEO|nr:alpha/beta-hydrolase [Karstenula rhodostoma CBS 690.94]